MTKNNPAPWVLFKADFIHPMTESDIEKLLTLLNEKEVALKERELALEEQHEEFLSQKEELNAAVEELMAKNVYLTQTLADLKKRNEELDQILYRASHDLRTPVSSLLGLITVMRSMGLTRDQMPVLEHMLMKSHQMETLLVSLSDLSIAFFHQPNVVTCSLAAIVQDAWRSVKVRDRIDFNCSVSTIELATDKLLLQILFRCLLQNAATFSRPDSQNAVTIDATTTHSDVTIEVGDCGEEIPEALSEKIFGMFYRASDRSQGPGLGLYIARQIAERLGGRIELINGGVSKKFVVTLPVDFSS